MSNRNKIQDWSGKRIDSAGQEYQIDTVFNEVRFIEVYEGMSYRTEHNAVEVSRKCGHVTVITDEYLNGDDRDETIVEYKMTRCSKCSDERINKRLDENENLAHLMPSDSPESY